MYSGKQVIRPKPLYSMKLAEQNILKNKEDDYLIAPKDGFHKKSDVVLYDKTPCVVKSSESLLNKQSDIHELSHNIKTVTTELSNDNESSDEITRGHYGSSLVIVVIIIGALLLFTRKY